MPFERSTLAEITNRVWDDIQNELPGVNARLRRSVERAIGAAAAGASHLLHGHLAELDRQLTWDRTKGSYLRRWAGIFGVTQLQPSLARATLGFTGVDAAEVPAGTEVTISGVDFITDHDATISGGTAIAAARAKTGQEGTAGNVEAGTRGQLISPTDGVDSSISVVSLDVEARDLESEEDLRSRFLERVRQPPKGGGPGDYVRWARATPTVAVERAWEYPRFLGGGTVGTIFVKSLDDMEGTGTDQIGTPSEVAAVHAWIGQFAPTTVAGRYTYTPIAQPLHPVIRVPDPDDVALQQSIKRSLNRLLAKAAPGNVVKGTSRTVLLSHLREAISQAEGETDHELVSPSADVMSEFGHLPILGTPVFEALT